MSKVVDIPGGQATIRDVGDLTVRQRRMIQTAGTRVANIWARLPEEVRANNQDRAALATALAELKLDDADAEALYSIQDATVVAFLESWTLDRPLPTMSTIGDLPGTVYDALSTATSSDGASVATGAASVDFDPVPDTTENADHPFDASPTSDESSVVA